MSSHPGNREETSPVMEYRTFGRTGLRVSVCGLGGGGESRLGLKKGSTEGQAIDLVQRAVGLGINYFDTAPNYGTEAVLGRALERQGQDRQLTPLDDGLELEAQRVAAAIAAR